MIKEIEALIDLLEARNLEEIKYKTKDTEIYIKKPSPVYTQMVPSVQPPVEPLEQVVVNAVKAPLVGTYYSKPAPDMAPFISVGDRVKKGDVICIIEAMKVMNELKSDRDGIVKDILKQDGDVVGFEDDLVVIG